ncbi:2-oxoacid:ferredoxin oxidoreductase subunit alpha [Candidatus Roizmanbacteria bacterium CG22_combo_CG10-13_8_21_14_all_35_9]|uniref:2-oxoacid:acceptor oxidoreductase subunit alpha n=4 Tax=Candidatus Roizmaniibacteriota TaxID=1752723 RepID=A0A2M8F2L2_9BACT|nr:MAG: 2-oxoacid:ferredoxin oxidoreductase subunit alpha [Candidatus Roizmanbacteria bacterium CG23_combo_of_CG06-09_8_20_14_all_35_49]PIP62854.1 MAG: 2-oxoacid:ferredoxin oxidoreductase subunit alpha [Candidatus Roizmanbacteria bacterium CG22_combo_CG10-13_8_21_14_all_35_9]PIY70889.1 MAG: 2-oxoacid:acceptor oxidoreductase subunit alpha [Candidatus Roizmanbacteria bacterium CG_4_10_14_0_8_um_filter_35_28]PJC33509.1 MAG: 2-oxoacid:acceptor oxidoreductase subunit alpha [Candidatus Roizmanbacteria
MIDFTWKIGGEAGFGIMTTGLVFSKIASRLGYYIFDTIEYPSLIRGGHNAYEVRVSAEKIHHLKKEIDVLVCLNEETFKKHQQRLTINSLVIFDEDEFKIKGKKYKKISIPLEKILLDLHGPVIMKNTIALGASLAVLGGKVDELLKIIVEQFGRKGEEVVNFNKQFAQTGYDYVKKKYPQQIRPLLIKKSLESKLVMTGNDAFSLASVIADCRFFCSYPMTPSSSVLTTLAAWQKKTGIVVRHAEDEISVINTALGTSFTGVRSAVGTSGGGFALMVEAVSLSGITETPLVIFLAQRPGPATGMPTWTEQGDLLFAVYAGHGEFPKIVLAPGDVEEMVELTGKAFNLADIYQLPVIVLSDMLLSESHESISKKFIDDFIKSYKVKRGKFLKEMTNDKLQMTNQVQNPNVKSKNFLRYKITKDGISPRLIPGTPEYFYQANSYEHLEDGHTTEEAEPRKNQVEKRNRKWLTYLKEDFSLPKVYGDLEKAKTVFVSWGSGKGAVLEAQKQLGNTALIHFTHVYPLDKEKVRPFFQKKKRYILVESNSWGQFGKLLQQETGVEIKERILKYDGRPITAEEVVKHVNSLTR